MVFRLDFRQISFNLVQKAFATQQFALLATSIPFYDIWARACAEIKILSDLRLQAFRFFKFVFFFSFLSFRFLFAAVIGLLLGLLAVKKTSKKASSRRANLTME